MHPRLKLIIVIIIILILSITITPLITNLIIKASYVTILLILEIWAFYEVVMYND